MLSDKKESASNMGEDALSIGNEHCKRGTSRLIPIINEKEIKVNMANLYQLNEEFKELMELMECDGVDEQTLADTMEGIKGELELKVEGYCGIIKNLSANIDALNAEAERMSKRADSIQKNVQWLETALKTYMESNGLKQLKSGVHEVKIVKNGGVQPLWVDEEKVPDTCMKVRYEIDRKLIREKLNAGETLPFAELKERGTHLSIK